MPGLPEITIAGTLTKDPELRYTASGHAVANFTVAANDRRYDSNTGKWEDVGATFLRCSVWRGTAENVAESLQRGQRVIVTGVLKQREYEAADGQQRTVFEVDATEVGVSLKWATADVKKASRANGQSTSDTPWNEASADAGAQPAPAAANTSSLPAEPPF